MKVLTLTSMTDNDLWRDDGDRLNYAWANTLYGLKRIKMLIVLSTIYQYIPTWTINISTVELFAPRSLIMT